MGMKRGPQQDAQALPEIPVFVIADDAGPPNGLSSTTARLVRDSAIRLCAVAFLTVGSFTRLWSITATSDVTTGVNPGTDRIRFDFSVWGSVTSSPADIPTLGVQGAPSFGYALIATALALLLSILLGMASETYRGKSRCLRLYAAFSLLGVVISEMLSFEAISHTARQAPAASAHPGPSLFLSLAGLVLSLAPDKLLFSFQSRRAS